MKLQLGLVVILLMIFAVRIIVDKEVYSDGDFIEISTQVNSEPVQYLDSQYLKLKGLKVYLPKYPKLYYGDKVVIQGVVRQSKLINPELITYTTGTNYIFNLRRKIISFYNSTLPQPYSSLVAGVAIGSKSEIPENFWNKLKSTGTVHIVVASGTNVSLVANSVLALFLIWFGRKKALALSFISIWLYVLLSGMDAPIVRAAIMGTIAFSAQALGKVYLSLNSLVLTALFMLIYNPEWRHDWGFIMSFLATLSLILFEPKVRRKLVKFPHLFQESLSSSIAAQIGVAPVLIFSFKQFNFFSPIYNMLVLWTVPQITIIGMLSGIVSLISESLAVLLLYLIYPFAFIFVQLVNWFSLI